MHKLRSVLANKWQLLQELSDEQNSWTSSSVPRALIPRNFKQHATRVADVSAKARIYLISQQDKTYHEYIRSEWPNVDVVLSNYDTFGAIAYGWGKLQPPKVKKYFGRVWMRKNILDNHGPLLDLYEHKDLRFRSEGDSPAFLHVINTGLRSDEDPTYGGWGGRFIKRREHFWRSADGKEQRPHSILRWAIDFQNDGAARADWCVKNYDQANHPPAIAIETNDDITSKPGEIVKLATLATDPDGDQLSYRWWYHRESSSYPTDCTFPDDTGPQTTVQVPKNCSAGQKLHMICAATDDGTPSMTRSRRIIITCSDN